jgi:hypothetical protein
MCIYKEETKSMRLSRIRYLIVSDSDSLNDVCKS